MKSNRRSFIRKMGTGAAGIALGTTVVSAATSVPPPANKKKEEDGQILFIGDNIALADTQYGKVKGYMLRGIYYFLGIPYGADTSGANRFMPPQKPKPWKDVYQAVWWGDSAPQIMEKKYANFFNGFLSHVNYSDLSEDCLRLNVFTPAINDGKKRPVIMYLHGGGFTSGNSIEQEEYNGENLARFGNIVFCSLNHRLGPIGYANLAAVGGDKFAASGNVGNLDMVAALEWVKDNIANFGGDPGNVTIMGHSGGGMKVTTLTAMPSAKGLIHKAVVLSGSATRAGDKAASEKLGTYVLKEAGLTAGELDKLQYIPWLEYIKIANRAVQRLSLETANTPGAARTGFGPVVDGFYMPQHPYDPVPTPLAADIPMIICSALNESMLLEPAQDNLTLDDVKGRIKPRAGDKAGEIVDSYVKIFPGRKPCDILSIIYSSMSGALSRKGLIDLADSKSKQNPPVYAAWMCWQPPLLDGHLRAFHSVDISFWFYNTDLMFTHTGGGSRPRKLSEKMAGALLQFMKTGDPNGGGLPSWPRYTTANGETMVLDDISESKNDPDREARKTLPVQ
jgi:para-nitrobenzyl esterase